jgi:hypothetical protein
MFPHRNVCPSQLRVSREQRRLCSGSAQAWLSSDRVCSGLLTPITRLAQLRLTSLEIINFNEARDPKHVTTYTILIDMGDYYLRRWLRPLVLIVTCLSSDLPPDLPALQGPG